MYLARFGVKNYKCLKDVEIPLTPLHVVIGPNDAGKTSLLEAMAALHQTPYEFPISQAFLQPWTGRELVFEGADSDTVELWGYWEAVPQGKSLATQSIGYGLAVRFPPEGNNCQLVDEWVQVEQKVRLTQTSNATALSRFLRGDLTPDPSEQEIFNTLGKVIRSAPIYSFNPRVMALPAALDPNRKFRMDRDGFGLPTMLHDILTADPERFLKLRDRFCELFPQFRSIRLETEKAIRRHHPVGPLWQEDVTEAGQGLRLETRTGRTIRGQQASDGTILMLGFLALSYLPEPPGLLLIEEPENGIYPKRLQEVVMMLRQMVHGAEGFHCPQIVFTTHSPFVVSFFEPKEVTFLSRDAGHPENGVLARPLRDAPHIRERLAEGQFYLGELWYNLSEEEIFGEFTAPSRD